MTARLRSAAHWLAILPLLVATTPASGEVVWDQERVTELVVELAAALKSIATDPALESMQSSKIAQRERLVAFIAVRQAQHTAANLARRLQKGLTREQTGPVFGQIQRRRQDIGWYASNSCVPESIRTKAEAVEKLLTQIAPYYGNR